MKFLSLLILLFSCISYGKTVKIAVIDTGFNMEYKKKVKFCHGEHRDFTNTDLKDRHGHGTNIVGLISKNNQNIDYCIVILKFYNMGESSGLSETINALKYAQKIKVNIINLSLGGKNPSASEKIQILRLLDEGVKIVAAAGNNKNNLDKSCDYYPACYDKRILVIGNKSKVSNYGKIVDEIIDGQNQYAFGILMSGTSQSAAIKTRRLIKEISGDRGKSKN